MPAAALRGLANGRLVRVFPLLVHAFEGRARQVDLAAHLEAARHVLLEAERNGPDRAHVAGDVLAPDAVAARHAADEHAVLVGERDAEAVDLQLGDVRDLERGLTGRARGP